MTAILATFPKFRAWTLNGTAPLVGGKLYTYEAGTTTPLATYTDQSGSTPNANPVILDASGSADVWLSSAAYKFKLEDSSGVIQWTVDDIQPDRGATILRSDLSDTSDAAKGDALICVKQPFTGGVARTQHAKNLETLTVTDFGAVGNGSTDDTAAIQAALTAAAGKVLTIPQGTYKVTSGLSVPANTTIYGYGATLSCTSSQFTALTFVNGGAVYGLTLVGPASATYDANGTGIKCSGTNNAPAAPTFVNAPTVRDCTIKNFGYHGVLLTYTNGGSVERCSITGIGYTGVGTFSSNDLLVTGNYISTIGPGPNNGDAYGVYVSRLYGASETEEPRSYRCTITGNDIRSVVATGGTNGQGIDTHGGADLTFSNNVITACQVGIGITYSLISATPALAPKRVVASGNVINGLSVNWGVLVSGAISGATIYDYAEQIVVEGNSITNHGAVNTATTGAIWSQATLGCNYSGNTIRNPQCVGIGLLQGNLGVSVRNNVIIDPHDATFAAPCCIRVSDKDNTGDISGNTFMYVNAALDTYVAVEAIRVASGLTGLGLTIGQSHFIGNTGTKLTYQELTSTGVNASTLMVQRGRGQVSLTNAASSSLTVTFGQRFPISTPRIQLTRNGTPVPGSVTKAAIIESGSLSDTSFAIVARPYDLSTFGGSGTLEVDWVATT